MTYFKLKTKNNPPIQKKHHLDHILKPAEATTRNFTLRNNASLLILQKHVIPEKYDPTWQHCLHTASEYPLHKTCFAPPPPKFVSRYHPPSAATESAICRTFVRNTAPETFTLRDTWRTHTWASQTLLIHNTNSSNFWTPLKLCQNRNNPPWEREKKTVSIFGTTSDNRNWVFANVRDATCTYTWAVSSIAPTEQTKKRFFFRGRSGRVTKRQHSVKLPDKLKRRTPTHMRERKSAIRAWQDHHPCDVHREMPFISLGEDWVQYHFVDFFYFWFLPWGRALIQL